MKTRMKSGDRRAAIVRAAIRLFAEKGFRGTTTRELAAAVGVTEPVLYQHFRDKRALHKAIVEAQAGELGGDGGELEQLAQAGDDRAFFRAAGGLIVSRFESNPEIPRLLLFSALERQDMSELFLERIWAGFQKQMAGYIRRRIREGGFRRVNAGAAARGFIGMISLHAFFGLLLGGRFGKADRHLVEEMTELFLDGIAR
jgi:TetR/AcrR family transcriptional regulator